MSVPVNIPEDLYEKAAEIAAAQRIPVEEVFASAFAEHLAQWNRLEVRAARGDSKRFQAVLDKVPDVEPDENDRLR